MTTLPRIGIVGYGRFGSAFAALLSEHRQPWLAWDAGRGVPADHAAGSVDELLAAAGLIVLAVPVHLFPDVLRALRPRLLPHHRVLDVCSVKEAPCALMDELLGDAVPHVGTHPLFGPLSISRAEPLRAVVCPSARHPAMAREAHALFAEVGSAVLDMSPAAHDRHMASTHAMAFFLARGLLELGIGEDLEWTPPSFAALASSIAAVRADAGHLFNAIQRENPYAAATRRRLIDALTRIDERVSAAPVDTGVLAVPAPDAAAVAQDGPDTAAARIDELDRELLALLGRRRELCARAAAIAPEHAAPSAAAEAVLSRRAQWGMQHGFAGDAVRALFRKVGALSAPDSAPGK